jgi:hypothetical protein
VDVSGSTIHQILRDYSLDTIFDHSKLYGWGDIIEAFIFNKDIPREVYNIPLPASL